MIFFGCIFQKVIVKLCGLTFMFYKILDVVVYAQCFMVYCGFLLRANESVFVDGGHQTPAWELRRK